MGAGRKTERPTRTLFEAEGVPRRSTVNGSVSAGNLSKKDLAGVIFGCKNHTKKECLTNLLFAEAERAPWRFTVNGSVSARNLSKKDLAGVIFGCKNHTKKECLTNLVFGLPDGHISYIRNITPGLPLFLFNYSDRTMLGIYEAAGHGMRNINPNAWTANGTEETEYPAQVRVRVRKQCQPLTEEQFREVLHKNYAMDQKHFWFELDHTQTDQLISLFELSKPSPSKFYDRPIQKRHYGMAAPNLDTRHEDIFTRTPATLEAGFKGFNTGIDLPAELPCPTGKWVSLFKKNSDSDPRSEKDDNQLASKGNWDNERRNCLNGTDMGPGPSVVTSCWEEARHTSMFSHCWKEGITPYWEDNTAHSGVNYLARSDSTPCWEEEADHSDIIPCWEEETRTSNVTPWKQDKQVIGFQSPKEAIQYEGERVYSKLKRLVFNRDGSDNNSVWNNGFPLGASSATAKGNSVFAEERIDSFVPHGMCNSHSEDGNTPVSPSTTDEFEDCCSNFDEQSVMEELMQELKEVKAYAMDQHSKTITLEKKLDDSASLLQHLQHRVMMLESHLQDPSTLTTRGYDGGIVRLGKLIWSLFRARTVGFPSSPSAITNTTHKQRGQKKKKKQSNTGREVSRA